MTAELLAFPCGVNGQTFAITPQQIGGFNAYEGTCDVCSYPESSGIVRMHLWKRITVF